MLLLGGCQVKKSNSEPSSNEEQVTRGSSGHCVKKCARRPPAAKRLLASTSSALPPLPTMIRQWSLNLWSSKAIFSPRRIKKATTHPFQYL